MPYEEDKLETNVTDTKCIHCGVLLSSGPSLDNIYHLNGMCKKK